MVHNFSLSQQMWLACRPWNALCQQQGDNLDSTWFHVWGRSVLSGRKLKRNVSHVAFGLLVSICHNARLLPCWRIFFRDMLSPFTCVTSNTGGGGGKELPQNKNLPEEVKVDGGVFGLDECPEAPKEVRSLQWDTIDVRCDIATWDTECDQRYTRCECVCRQFSSHQSKLVDLYIERL